MNNFYASVECMLNPALRDKVVVVGGSVEQRHGIVLAKNDRAKAFGIQTGEAIWQARQKCHDIVVVPPHFAQYLRFSARAREIYARYTDLVEAYGMDECWLDVTGSRSMGSGEEIAEEIRQAVRFELGVTVSIGVSFNKVFAKLGSDMKKPDAITTIYRSDFQEKLWHLPAGALLGVGRATRRKLSYYGIHTIGALAAADEAFLSQLLGIHGVRLKEFANGCDPSKVTQNDYVAPIKSVGHGITTTQDLENSAEVWSVMLALVQDIGTKLRRHKKVASGVAISVRNQELVIKEWQCKLPMPTQSPSLLAKAAFALFDAQYEWQCDIRSLTVRAIDLLEEHTPTQIDMFTDVSQLEKRERLDMTIEAIRTRFGKGAIKAAVLCQPSKLPHTLDTGVIMPTGMVQ